MNKRSENMKRVNQLRSEVTAAVIALLDHLEEGTGGGYEGFYEYDIQGYSHLKGQLNSYRAQKITQSLGKPINKQRLLKYSKPKDYEYSVTNKEILRWLEANKVEIRRYLNFSIKVETSGERSLY